MPPLRIAPTALPLPEMVSAPPVKMVVAVVEAPDETVTVPPLSTVALSSPSRLDVVPSAGSTKLVSDVVSGFSATLTPLLTVRPASMSRAPAEIVVSDTFAPTQNVWVPPEDTTRLVAPPPETTVSEPPVKIRALVAEPPAATEIVPPLFAMAEMDEPPDETTSMPPIATFSPLARPPARMV